MNQDDQFFDALYLLCQVAEELGYDDVVVSLEFALDVFLREREQIWRGLREFRSRRSGPALSAAEIAAWRGIGEDLPERGGQGPVQVGWSMSDFPLRRFRPGPERAGGT